jgi:hypothetical protein
MGQQDIVEAIVKLLWACKSENKERIPSEKLPHAMTVKYKAATTIANAIKVGNFVNLGLSVNSHEYPVTNCPIAVIFGVVVPEFS